MLYPPELRARVFQDIFYHRAEWSAKGGAALFPSATGRHGNGEAALLGPRVFRACAVGYVLDHSYKIEISCLIAESSFEESS